jgi:hypothetical protein
MEGQGWGVLLSEASKTHFQQQHTGRPTESERWAAECCKRIVTRWRIGGTGGGQAAVWKLGGNEAIHCDEMRLDCLDVVAFFGQRSMPRALAPALSQLGLMHLSIKLTDEASAASSQSFRG